MRSNWAVRAARVVADTSSPWRQVAQRGQDGCEVYRDLGHPGIGLDNAVEYNRRRPGLLVRTGAALFEQHPAYCARRRVREQRQAQPGPARRSRPSQQPSQQPQTQPYPQRGASPAVQSPDAQPPAGVTRCLAGHAPANRTPAFLCDPPTGQQQPALWRRTEPVEVQEAAHGEKHEHQTPDCDAPVHQHIEQHCCLLAQRIPHFSAVGKVLQIRRSDLRILGETISRCFC